MQIEVRDSDLIRFANKVALPDDIDDKLTCWLWQGAKHGQGRGYGKFRLGGKVMSAHKASYLLLVGPVEDGLVVGHQCDNERCVSPYHLKAESQSSNMLHCIEAGRHNSCKKVK